MFSDESLVISSDNKSSESDNYSHEPNPNKKIIIWALLAIAIIAFIVILVIIIKKQTTKMPPIINPGTEVEEPSGPSGNLPITDKENGFGFSTSTLFTDTAIEYLAFTDFYDKPQNDFAVNINNYELPINIKIDGMNYYDLSRRLNLDAGIDSLNNYGFAILNNPWQNEISDFYSMYEKLEQQQIPFLITSDFLVYYYQNMMKKVFKEIEEHVFFQNLWLINKELYEIAKNRYEARLAMIGNINDAILEGQRMEMAFFAVTLELLKPAQNQIAAKGAIEDRTKFNEGDVERFSLNLPNYLREDVQREVNLIRAGRETAKSPNLLYIRNYTEFAVPKEYKSDAKLNNFYLAAKWINSVFPVHYKSDDCPNCLLDQEDWRISMIAASLISQDFSSRPDLKTRWARIYKLIGFFQGLREEIDYVNFRDSLARLFSEDYDIEELFSDRNPESFINLEKLKNQLLARDYPPIRGALDKTDLEVKPLVGFKMLADFYWPNEFIFNSVTWPVVGRYEGTGVRPITVCSYNRVDVRCNGFSLDIINLITPMTGNPVFDKNALYVNYQEAAKKLTTQFKRDGLWHTSNYWSTLILMDTIINPPLTEKPIFMKSETWQQRNINSATAAWVNLQLPLENVALAPVFTGSSLSDFARFDENVYVEPNLPLINELIATNKMLAQMFTALRLNEEINLASQRIQSIDNDLQIIKKVVEKELSGEALNSKDAEELTEFARKYALDQNRDERDKILQLNWPKYKISLKQDLNQLKLLAVVHESNGNKIISVGPIWHHRESR